MDIIYPMFCLAGLTLLVSLGVGVTRVFGVKSGQLDPEYLTFISGGNPPDYVVLFARNLSNLLEMPILFYVITLLSMVLNIHSSLIITLAWAYVVLRMLHTAVHLTYNKPLHRMLPYGLSNFILFVLWAVVMLAAVQQGSDISNLYFTTEF